MKLLTATLIASSFMVSILCMGGRRYRYPYKEYRANITLLKLSDFYGIPKQDRPKTNMDMLLGPTIMENLGSLLRPEIENCFLHLTTLR